MFATDLMVYKRTTTYFWFLQRFSWQIQTSPEEQVPLLPSWRHWQQPIAFRTPLHVLRVFSSVEIVLSSGCDSNQRRMILKIMYSYKIQHKMPSVSLGLHQKRLETGKITSLVKYTLHMYASVHVAIDHFCLQCWRLWTDVWREKSSKGSNVADCPDSATWLRLLQVQTMSCIHKMYIYVQVTATCTWNITVLRIGLQIIIVLYSSSVWELCPTVLSTKKFWMETFIQNLWMSSTKKFILILPF